MIQSFIKHGFDSAARNVLIIAYFVQIPIVGAMSETKSGELKLGFIGAGAMASALVKGLVAANVFAANQVSSLTAQLQFHLASALPRFTAATRRQRR